MVSYEGIFFEEEASNYIHSLEEERLPLVNDVLHCTFVYHPSEEDLYDELVGKEVEVYLVGYASNGKNSGFEITFPKEYNSYYKNYEDPNKKVWKKPHVTATIAEGAKPYQTKNLKFKKLKHPIKVIGKFGYWIKEEEKEYLTFEKQK